MYPLSQNLSFNVGTILSVLSFSVLSQASIDTTTGLCNVFTFVPFTDNGATAKSITDSSDRVNPGFVHMAAALMAMEHFNARNASVVPELEDFVDCRYMFDINRSRMFDSGTVTHIASRSLSHAGETPCAIAGPYHDMPALDLSVMAQADEIPLVIHRSFNLLNLVENRSPFSSQIYPDPTLLAKRAVEFLLSKGRTDYISIFYPMSEEGLQWKDMLTSTLQTFGMETFPMVIYDRLKVEAMQASAPSVLSNMEMIKKRGFRTIVVILDGPKTHVNLPSIADAAEELGMNNGDYFWVWLGENSGSYLYSDNPNITKLLYGSAYVFALEKNYLSVNGSDPFTVAFTSQGADFSERVNNMNPIPPGEPGYAYAPPDFFTTMSSDLEHGVAFLYDAVMSIGIGACKAENGSGVSHLNGIRRSDFSGASGRVRFQGSGALPGARDGTTAYFGVLNSVPELGSGDEKPWRITDVFLPELGRWDPIQNFTFADGRIVPPDYLRNPPEQNYLPKGLRILGFVLLGIVLASAIATSVWVFWKREHIVLRAAQPVFLYVLSFGAAVFSSALVPLSFDESYGWSEAQLSAGCMSTIWLIACGHIITYCALFSKLWRVNKVLQFTRRKIEIRHVVWPAGILVLSTFVILGLWTGLDPLAWTRVEIDPYTGESIGFCDSENKWAFIGPLIVVVLIPTWMTGVMAWKTKDVDESYSESWWIFALILVQAELVCIGVPVIAILRSVSTTGRYVGSVLILWFFPMSTLLLIMLPKVMAYVKSVGGIKDGGKRGARSGCRVSGLSPDSTPYQDGQVSAYMESSYLNEPESGAHTKQTHEVPLHSNQELLPPVLQSLNSEDAAATTQSQDGNASPDQDLTKLEYISESLHSEDAADEPAH